MAYPTVFPTSIDSYTLNADGVDDVLAADVNELQSAIVAIETKLGTGQFHAATGDGATWGFKAGASLDVLWYRGGANLWQTPDSVTVDGNLIVGGVTGARSITLSSTSSSILFYLSTPAENARDIAFQTGGVNRWFIRCGTVAESGSDAGSDFSIISRHDDGTSLSTVLLITRSSGAFKITGAFGCNGTTPQTSYASGGAVAPGAGAFGFSSAANAAALATLVSNIRAALVANGIMS
jgi:hypothetical protein